MLTFKTVKSDHTSHIPKRSFSISSEVQSKFTLQELLFTAAIVLRKIITVLFKHRMETISVVPVRNSGFDQSNPLLTAYQEA